MKSTVLVTIEHKNIDDIADIVAARIWSREGITAVQAQLVEVAEEDKDWGEE